MFMMVQVALLCYRLKLYWSCSQSPLKVIDTWDNRGPKSSDKGTPGSSAQDVGLSIGVLLGEIDAPGLVDD